MCITSLILTVFWVLMAYEYKFLNEIEQLSTVILTKRRLTVIRFFWAFLVYSLYQWKGKVNTEEKKNGNDWKHKKTFSGHTGYFLAGAIPVVPAIFHVSELLSTQKDNRPIWLEGWRRMLIFSYGWLGCSAKIRMDADLGRNATWKARRVRSR